MIPGPAVDRAMQMRLSGYGWNEIKAYLQALNLGEFSEKDIEDAVDTAYPKVAKILNEKISD